MCSPLHHKTIVVPTGLEPILFWTKTRRVANYTTGQFKWERQYAEAQRRFLAHKKQKAEAQAAEAAATPAE